MLKQSVKAKDTYNGFIFELKDCQKKKNVYLNLKNALKFFNLNIKTCLNHVKFDVKIVFNTYKYT